MYLQRTPNSPLMKIESEDTSSNGSITGVFRLKEVDKEGIEIFSSVDDDDEFDDDDDYEDDDFIEDTGTPIQDAPPLDIL